MAFAGGLPTAEPSEKAGAAQILILSAYHSGYRWSDAVLDGLRTTLIASRPNARLYVEYLDSKRLYSQATMDRLADLIRVKYNSVRLNALIVADDNALAFLRRYRGTLFRGIPTVFCGANNVDLQGVRALAPITGVNEAADVKATIDAALALLPDTRHIVVVNDTTPTGRNVHKEIRNAAAAYADQITFAYLEALPFETLLRRLRQLESGAIVLFSFFFRDSEGRFFEYDESAAAICAAAPVPVFGLWEFNLGHGIVGGKLVSGVTQGINAGELTLRILAGEHADEIPIMMRSPNRFAFDYARIQQFSLNADRLPAGSHLINRPRRLYETHKALIWSVTVALTALTLLSACLLVAIRRGRRSQTQLRSSQDFLTGITRNIPGVVYQFYATDAGKYGMTYISERSRDILALEPDPETFLENVARRIHAADVDRFWSSVKEAVAREAPWHFEGRYIKTPNETLWLTGDSTPHREGTRLLFDGVLVDTTARKQRIEDQRLRLEGFQRHQTALIAMGNHTATIDGDMTRATRFLTESMAHALDVARVGVWMLDDAGEKMVLVDGYDGATDAHTAGDLLETAQYPSYFTAQRRDWIIAADNAVTDPRTAELADGYLVPNGIGALLDAGIFKAGKLAGVICHEHTAGARTWDTDEISLARSASEFLSRTLMQAEHLDAQAALGELQRRQTQIIDFLPDPTFVIDTAGRVIVWNRAIAEVTGVPAEEMLGQDNYAYAVPFYGHRQPLLIDLVLNWDPAVADTYIEIRRDGDVLHSENWNELVAGERRYFRNAAGPLLNETGNVIGAIEITRDVTEQHRAATELRRRWEFLESVLYHAPDAIIILDDDHRVMEWNPGAEKIFGYQREEALGNELDALVAQGEIRREANRKTTIVLGGRRVEAFETHRHRKDGTAVAVIAAGSPILVDGRLIGVVAMYTDISNLKQAEAAIREREQMLRLVLDTIPVRVFWKDREGRYLGCNRAFAADAGRATPDEMLGKDDYAMTWAPEAALYRKDDDAVMASGEPRLDYEEVQTTPTGGKIWLNTSKVPMRDAQNQIIGVLGTYQDITERKVAEEEVRRLRNYLANIINSMPSVLVGVDAEGRVTQWNREAEKLTGLSFERVAAQPLDAALPFLKPEIARIQKAIRDRLLIHDPKIARHQDGETRFLDLTIYPLVANGVEGAVIRVDDVTERVRLEEMMIQSEKMLSVGGLAAGMAHEINNPLAGILQNAAVLENRLVGDLPANDRAAAAAGTTMAAIGGYLHARRIPEMVDAIRASGKRAAAIVRNMLSFARKGNRDIARHRLDQLLDQTIELVQTDYDMKKQYDFKRIAIKRAYAEAPPVPCEESKIQQVFLNVLKNGAEAMAIDTAGGSPQFSLRVADDDAWVRVEIEDNGPGIPEAVRKRIFEPFFTTKEVGKGTGLGLSVSYFIITEDHGGKMSVTSEPGRGTRFTIRLLKQWASLNA